MTIRIRGLVCNNNGGDGIRIEGDVPLDAEDIRAEGNGGQGLNIIRHAGLLEQLGLPKETDPHALAELLKLLQKRTFRWPRAGSSEQRNQWRNQWEKSMGSKSMG